MVNALTISVGISSIFSFVSSEYWVDYSTKCTLSSCDSVTPLDFAEDFTSSNTYVMYQTSQGTWSVMSNVRFFTIYYFTMTLPSITAFKS